MWPGQEHHPPCRHPFVPTHTHLLSWAEASRPLGLPNGSQPTLLSNSKANLLDTKTKSLPVTDDWNQNYSEPSDLSICEVSNRDVVFENKDGECYFF